MTQQHIDNDSLVLYVKLTARNGSATSDEASMSASSYDDILDHLAVCEECRDQVSVITTLQDEWTQLRQPSSLSEEQQQMICDYVDGLLRPDEADSAKVFINSQSDAMKAALHYQTHIESMEVQHPGRERKNQSEKQTQLSQNKADVGLLYFLGQFFSIRSPMIYTVTATAAVLLAVVLVLQSPDMQQDTMVIASYQDNPTIKYTAKNKLPGVGFFTQSTNSSKPFEDIHIELIAKNTVKLTWSKIEGAELYKMRLQVFNQGKKTTLIESSSQTNHTTFRLEADHLADATSKRYEWILFGNTTDDKMFYATGGFVISKSQTGSASDEADGDYDSW